MVDEGAAKALVAKDRPAKLADVSRRGQPAGTLEVEVADALQEKVVLLIQEVGAEFFGGRHHIPGWRVLLAVEVGLFVVTKALAVRNLGRFWSSVKKAQRPFVLNEGGFPAGFIPLNQATKPLIPDLNFTKVAESKLNLIVSPDNPLLEKGTLTVHDLRHQRFALFNDVANEQIFRHLQFLCGPLKVIINLDNAWSMYATITKLNAVCLGRTFQTHHSPYSPLADLPEIELGDLIDNHLEFGWLTNPNDELSATTVELTRMVTLPFKKTPDRARSGELFIASPLSGDQFLSAKTVNPSSSL